MTTLDFIHKFAPEQKENFAWLSIYEFDFEKNKFIYDSFDTMTEAIKAIDVKGYIYDGIYNVNKDYIKEFLKEMRKAKFGDNWSWDRLNSIIKREGITCVGSSQVFKIIKESKRI